MPAFTTEDTFRALLECAPDAMVIVDGEGEIVIVNEQAETMFGYSRLEMLGESIELLVPERFRDQHPLRRRRYLSDPRSRSIGAGLELHGRRKDGSEFPVEISLRPLETDGGTLISGAIRDITERKRAENEASHFAAVVESSHDAIIGMDLDGTITSWNAGAERLYGYRADEIRGRSIVSLVPTGREDEVTRILPRVRLGERIDDFETVRERKDGTHVDVSLTVSPIRDRSGRVVGASTIARDITDHLRHLEQLRYLAEHDEMTGARNRRRFEQDISAQVGRARRYGERAALLIVDIDRFKQINDTHGHRTGDRALKAIVAALEGRLRETDVVARIGGDEFGVLLPYADRSQALVVAEAVRKVIEGCRVEAGDGARLRLSVSIGLVLIDENVVSDEDVLARADRAMYRDKASRRESALDFAVEDPASFEPLRIHRGGGG